MARKNVFDLPSEDDKSEAPAPRPDQTRARPLLGLDRPLRQASPLGAISQSLDGINAKVKRADEIEQRLASGQMVVELDPDLVDASFVADRMDTSEEQHQEFVAQIRAHGQQTPILVRPKIGVPGRFEVAYGHRRLRAARALGLKVRAVVRNLSDEELVVAQGQENNARTDLTFIERARFATRLEDRKFSRETIMSALAVDKAALSRLISTASRIPPDIIDAIGPAPSYGRVRWQELTELIEKEVDRDRAREIVAEANFGALASDQRFEFVYDGLKQRAIRARPEPFTASDGARLARVLRTDKKLTLAFDNRVASDFGDFVTSRLQALYDEYKAQARQKN